MTWLHGITFPLTCGLLPACPPYTHGNDGHQARVKGAIKLAINVCTRCLRACRECGSVTGGTFENNTGWKRGLSVASVRGRIVGCYIQTGNPAMSDFGVDTNGKHGLCVSTSEMCRGLFLTGVFAWLTEVGGRNDLKEQVTQNSQCHHEHVIPKPYYFAMLWNSVLRTTRRCFTSANDKKHHKSSPKNVLILHSENRTAVCMSRMSRDGKRRKEKVWWRNTEHVWC